MKRYRAHRRLRGLEESCRGVKWRCDSKHACYGLLGDSPDMYGRLLLRAECTPNGKCKAEVLVGRFMVGRKRGLKSMSEAKTWACEKARQ